MLKNWIKIHDSLFGSGYSKNDHLPDREVIWLEDMHHYGFFNLKDKSTNDIKILETFLTDHLLDLIYWSISEEKLNHSTERKVPDRE